MRFSILLKRFACLVGIVALPSGAFAAESSYWTPSSARALTDALAAAPSILPEPAAAVIVGEQDPGVKAAPPAEPPHTGFKALVKDTGKDFVSFPKRKSTWVILGAGAALAGLAHPIDDDVNDKLVGSTNAGRFFKAGKIIGATYTQIGIALGMYMIGRYALPPDEAGGKTNRWSHLGFDLLRAQFLSQAVVQGIKYSVRRDRPTGECCAFPSGHAASAFAAAAVIERHLGYRVSWPITAVATYVGMSRIVDNRHFLSDVVFGAAVGTAAGWTVVGRHGRDTYALVPMPIHGGIALMATRTKW